MFYDKLVHWSTVIVTNMELMVCIVNKTLQSKGESSMKYINIIFGCFVLTSSLAFALDGLPYGNDAQSVRVEGGKVNVKGMNGQSVNVDGGNVNVKGMSGETVSTGGGNVNAKGMNGQGVSTKGGAGKQSARDEDGEAKETAPAEDKD